MSHLSSLLSETLLSFSGAVGGGKGAPVSSVEGTVTETLFSLVPQIEDKPDKCNLLDNN